MNCRFCGNVLKHEFIDLGSCPPSNSFVKKENLDKPEAFYPLKLFVCEQCFLVQAAEYKRASEIFNDEYVYFSSYSASWLEHARQYAEMMIQRFSFNDKSQVIEIASNDGYLLQYFQQKNIPVLGIEPTANTAEEAKKKGIESVVDFFGVKLAKKLIKQNIKADLLLGNNVLAHVPDINDFVAGMKIILQPKGVITMEFPHLVQLIENNQFDTIYHEHFSYLSFTTVKSIFAKHGLELFDVDEIPTHGGSLRIYAKHTGDESKPVTKNVKNIIDKEKKIGISELNYYKGFSSKVNKIKTELLQFLIEQKKVGKKVAGYGAAAKGNTLLNYCGIKNDLINFVADASPYKQGKYLPGSHIPVVNEKKIKDEKPDYILILPWNIQSEIKKQINYISDWNAKFVVAIPELIII